MSKQTVAIVAAFICLVLIILMFQPTNYSFPSATTKSYCEVHIHDANAPPVAVASGTDYTKVMTYTNSEFFKDCTVTAIDGNLIPDVSGTYRVCGNMSFASSRNNTNWFGAAFVNNDEANQCHWERSIGTANSVGSAGFCCLADVNAGQPIDFRVRHDNGASTNIIINYSQLVAVLQEVK